jgi:hypothetical protein
MSERPDIMPPVMPVNRFCEFSGFGRTTIYKLIKLGELKSQTMCGRRFIDMDSYYAYVRRTAEQEARQRVFATVRRHVR